LISFAFFGVLRQCEAAAEAAVERFHAMESFLLFFLFLPALAARTGFRR
jgi:hypothetical protein